MDNLVRELREAGEWAMPKPDLNKLLHRAADEIERLGKLIDLHKENNKAVFAACEVEIERLKS